MIVYLNYDIESSANPEKFRRGGQEANMRLERMDFSFALDGEEQTGGGAQTEFCFGNLTVRRRLRQFGGGTESLLTWENEGSSPTGRLREVCDLDLTAEVGRAPLKPGFLPPTGELGVFSSRGSDWSASEFIPVRTPLPEGESLVFRPRGGRSSQGVLPFFDLNLGKEGLLIAVGWTGQWFLRFDREEDRVRVRAGVEPLDFYLLPGERVRTASVFVMPYDGGQTAAHNAFRQIIRERYLRAGGPKPPLFLNAWGGASSAFMEEAIAKAPADIEGFWADAGWYGAYEGSCHDEFTGEWGRYTGDWQVNPGAHPDGLKEVYAAAGLAGLERLLWLEPERAFEGTPLLREHPGWFRREPVSGQYLLDLGNPEAREAVFALWSGLIRELNLSWVRQDFNIDPLPAWEASDPEGRRGIAQLKHIEGLYRLWEDLRAAFPGLGIDNCASGGRRLDWESCGLTLPLWRSDYACSFNADGEAQQNHQTGLSWWLPFHGTGTTVTPVRTTYEMRSVYAPGLVVRMFAYPEIPSDQDPVLLERLLKEYKRVRPFLSGDFFPVFGFPSEPAAWNGGHYRLPDRDEGLLLAFRRPESVCPEAELFLEGLCPEGRYETEDADTGERKILSGAELSRLTLRLPQRPSSALLFYRRV